MVVGCLARPTVEMLNLWNDFRKVVDFIDINREWLTERMQVIALKPYRYTMESLR